MKASDVWASCNEIAALGDDDPEMTHGMEDALALRVLSAVARDECDDPASACRYVAALMATDRVRHYS